MPPTVSQDAAPQFVHGQRARVEHLVGNPSNGLEQAPLFQEALGDGPVERQRMRPARFAEPPEQRAVAGVEKHEPHLVRIPRFFLSRR